MAPFRQLIYYRTCTVVHVELLPLSLPLPITLPLLLPLPLPLPLPHGLSVGLSVCLSVFLFLCRSVCLSVCLPGRRYPAHFHHRIVMLALLAFANGSEHLPSEIKMQLWFTPAHGSGHVAESFCKHIGFYSREGVYQYYVFGISFIIFVIFIFCMCKYIYIYIYTSLYLNITGYTNRSGR